MQKKNPVKKTSFLEWWMDPNPVNTIRGVIRANKIENAEGKEPKICHYHPTPYGWHIVLHCPSGIGTDEVTRYADQLEEQTHSMIDTTVKHEKIHLDVCLKDLPEGKYLPFEFNPAEHVTKKNKVVIPIGLSHFGPITCDLSKLPHLFIAGESGSGKTTEIINILFALLMQGVEVHLIDLKQVDYAFLRGLCPMTEEGKGIMPLLKRLEEIRKERAAKLVKAKVRNWREYPFDDMPYTVLIVDEVAEIRDPKAHELLISHARLDRVVGISIISACQRPSAAAWKNNLFREFISLFDAKICYRVMDGYNSEIVLGKGNQTGYTHVLPEQYGRGIWKYTRECIIQSMFVKDPYAEIEKLGLKPKEVEEVGKLPGELKVIRGGRDTENWFSPE